MHGLIDHLLALHSVRLDARYLECFGESPNRTRDKLMNQHDAAIANIKGVEQFIPGVHQCEWTPRLAA
jgi:hypothetical protein